MAPTDSGWKLSDTIALASLAVALFALGASVWYQRRTFREQMNAQVRQRVWEVLNQDAGMRSVVALEHLDGKFDTRVLMLRRTEFQLEAAMGRPDLAAALKACLDAWVRSPDLIDQKEKARNDFFERVNNFFAVGNADQAGKTTS